MVFAKQRTWALLRGHDKLDFKLLLDDSTNEGFLLNGNLHSDSAGMGLGPDKRGVNNAHFVKTLQTTKAKGEELLRFESRDDPAGGGSIEIQH